MSDSKEKIGNTIPQLNLLHRLFINHGHYGGHSRSASRQSSRRRSDYNSYPPLGLPIVEVGGRHLLSLWAYISKACRSSRPYLAVGLEVLYHQLPLGLVLPEVTEE